MLILQVGTDGLATDNAVNSATRCHIEGRVKGELYSLTLELLMSNVVCKWKGFVNLCTMEAAEGI